MRVTLKANSIEELLSLLEKNYGPDWYDKVSVLINEVSGQIEAAVEPLKAVDTQTALGNIGSIKIEHISLPELSLLEEQCAEPIVRVIMSEDKMTASVMIIPGFKRVMPTVEEIKQALSDAKVVYGIDEGAIEKIVKEQRIFSEIPVAFGKKPILPKDASVEFLFPASGFVLEKPQEGGSIDPASLYKIFTCNKGDVLAIKRKAFEGEDGVTVTGELVKVQEPKDINLASFIGENVRLSPDGMQILANCDGQPYLKDSKVNVRELLVIDKDLGYDTGNINFNGSVVISGNAEGPFKVRVKGDLLILGVLGEIHVNCGGSLRVQGGVFAKGKGSIKVGKDFAARFVNEALIFCGGDVLVEDYVMNSTIICKGNVKVFGRGVIVGGSVKANGDVEASEIGSDAAVRTEICAGIDYEYEESYAQLQRSLLRIMNQLGKFAEAENSFRVQLMQTKDLAKRESIRTIMQKIMSAKDVLQKRLHKVRTALNILRHRADHSKLRLKARIRVRRACHQNVRVRIGLSSKVITDKLGPCEFFLNDRGDIECR
ncbi:DUF342 domain-containing protein [Pseudothermotoga sp.]